MRDDPEAIKLRKEHQDWMRTAGSATEAREEIETIIVAHPSWFLRLMLWIIRWIERTALQREEDARVEARATYEQTNHGNR